MMSWLFPHLASVHLYVMGFLALGLLASVNWLLAELKKGGARPAEKGAAKVDARPEAAAKKADSKERAKSD